MKITSSRINTLLAIGENLNIEFKCAGDGPKDNTFESPSSPYVDALPKSEMLYYTRHGTT